MSRAKRDPEKEAFWRLVREEHQRSGLTAREFCVKEGLSEASFHYWKRVLAERDREANAPPKGRSSGRRSRKGLASKNQKNRQSSGPNTLVPVEIVPSPIAPSQELTIRTPAGFTIDLPPTVDIVRFGEVLELLASHSRTSVQRGAS